MSKRVLVTGASSGFGRLTVEALINQGDTVIATMRGIEGRNKEAADAIRTAGAHVVELDVTSEESVNTAVEEAVKLADGIDVVVNNAGVGVLGFQEAFTADDWQKVFDVNVFGVQRVNRAVIPHMRSKGSGLFIYVTSLLGRITMPFYGPYNATKWAMEALAENYRAELSGFGIDSVIVEPGGFPTDFFGKLITPDDDTRLEAYGPMKDAPKQMFDSFEGALAQNPAQKPELVSEAIVGLINAEPGTRPFRTAVDKMGMGDHITPYNEQQEQITQGIFSAFGMSDMLKLKTD